MQHPYVQRQKGVEWETRLLFFAGPEQPQQPAPEAEKDKKEGGEQKEAQEKQLPPEELKRKGVDERKTKAEDDVKKLSDRTEGAQKKAAELNKKNGAERPPVSSDEIARMTEVSHMRQTKEATGGGGVGGVGSEWSTEGGKTEVVIRPNDPNDLAEIQARCAKAGIQLEVQNSPGPDGKQQAELVLKDATPANRAKVGHELINMALEKKGYPPLKEGMRGQDDMSEQEKAMIEAKIKPIADRIDQLRQKISSTNLPPVLRNLPIVLKDLAPAYWHPSGELGAGMPLKEFAQLSQMATKAGVRKLIRIDVAPTSEGPIVLTKQHEAFLKALEDMVNRAGATGARNMNRRGR